MYINFSVTQKTSHYTYIQTRHRDSDANIISSPAQYLTDAAVRDSELAANIARPHAAVR